MKQYGNFFCWVIIVLSFCRPGSAQIHSEIRDTSVIRVLTYNIHHCNPPSEPGKIDIAAVATVIKEQQPDLVALQEVDVFTARSGGIDQAAELGKITGMYACFGKAIDYDGGQYGVAVLSKYPVEKTEVVNLPNDEQLQSEPRVLLMAKMRIGNKSLYFGVTHLDVKTEETRICQAKKINEVTDTMNIPVMLAGDLNATPESESLKILETKFSRTCRPCEYTIPAVNPRSTIDYIMFSKKSSLKVNSIHVLEKYNYPSDHLPVLGVFRFM